MRAPLSSPHHFRSTTRTIPPPPNSLTLRRAASVNVSVSSHAYAEAHPFEAGWQCRAAKGNHFALSMAAPTLVSGSSFTAQGEQTVGCFDEHRAAAEALREGRNLLFFAEMVRDALRPPAPPDTKSNAAFVLENLLPERCLRDRKLACWAFHGRRSSPRGQIVLFSAEMVR